MASGKVKCKICDGSAMVNCQTCGAQGWRHKRTKIFTDLINTQNIEYGNEIPKDLIPNLKTLFEKSLSQEVEL